MFPWLFLNKHHLRSVGRKSLHLSFHSKITFIFSGNVVCCIKRRNLLILFFLLRSFLARTVFWIRKENLAIKAEIPTPQTRLSRLLNQPTPKCKMFSSFISFPLSTRMFHLIAYFLYYSARKGRGKKQIKFIQPTDQQWKSLITKAKQGNFFSFIFWNSA